jgi:hypothetical protein
MYIALVELGTSHLIVFQVLEEMALTVQLQLVDAKLPFCAFNGGTGKY